jgi:hypothetical protein
LKKKHIKNSEIIKIYVCLSKIEIIWYNAMKSLYIYAAEKNVQSDIDEMISAECRWNVYFIELEEKNNQENNEIELQNKSFSNLK